VERCLGETSFFCNKKTPFSPFFLENVIVLFSEALGRDLIFVFNLKWRPIGDLDWLVAKLTDFYTLHSVLLFAFVLSPIYVVGRWAFSSCGVFCTGAMKND
jgi:hypothetical protein